MKVKERKGKSKGKEEKGGEERGEWKYLCALNNVER